MRNKKSAPAAPGLKKFILMLGALMALFIINVVISGCSDEPSTAACLHSGNPWGCEDIEGDGGSGGDGQGGDGGSNPGGKTCKDNPYYGQPCLDPATGKPGHYMCTSDPNSLQVACVPDNPGGGNGTCLDNPLLGTVCSDVNGHAGHFVCASNGKDVACLGDGSNPGGTTCQQNPTYNQVCSANGKPGHFLCPSGANTPVCTEDPTNPSSNCTTNPALGQVCALNGQPGHLVCASNGKDLSCLLDNPGGGNPTYTCESDPYIGQPCANGVGACITNGTFACNPGHDGHYCPAVPGTPNPVELCATPVDDNCNGQVNEPGCSTGGGGSGGSGGGGSGGTGPHGEAPCTTVTSAFINVQGAGSLTTFKNGSLSVSSSNPLGITLANNEWLSWAADGGLSVNTTTANAKVNVWEIFFPGDSTITTTTDSLNCLLNGVTPVTPETCHPNESERLGVQYMDHLGTDLGCWWKGTCPAAIVGHVPSDLFILKKLLTQASPLSGNSWTGRRRGVIHMPPLCP